MCYVFSRHVLRTFIAIAAFACGFALIAFTIYKFDGNFFIAMIQTFGAYALVSFSSRTFIDLYGRISRNYRRYQLEPCLSVSNTALSAMNAGLGYKLKSVDSTSFYVIHGDRLPNRNIIVSAYGVLGESAQFKHRLRKLARYYYVWSSKEKINRQDKPLFAPRACNERFTYAVTEITTSTFNLKRAEYKSTIVDQKLLARRLTIFGTELNNSMVLLEDKENRVTLKAPQETDFVVGLRILALFISADGYVVPESRIGRCFSAYYLGDFDGDLITFCKKQVEHHLAGTDAIAELSISGIGLIIEDVGAPVLACSVGLRSSWSTLMSHCGLPDLPPQKVDITFSNASASSEEALLKYLANRSAK